MRTLRILLIAASILFCIVANAQNRFTIFYETGYVYDSNFNIEDTTAVFNESKFRVRSHSSFSYKNGCTYSMNFRTDLPVSYYSKWLGKRADKIVLGKNAEVHETHMDLINNKVYHTYCNNGKLAIAEDTVKATALQFLNKKKTILGYNCTLAYKIVNDEIQSILWVATDKELQMNFASSTKLQFTILEEFNVKYKWLNRVAAIGMFCNNMQIPSNTKRNGPCEPAYPSYPTIKVFKQ